MKKFVFAAIFTAIAITAVGCTSITKTATTEPEQQGHTVAVVEPEEVVEVEDVEETGPNLGDYDVVINSWNIVNDYEGNPAISIVYDFTNYYEKAESYMLAINEDVYQNGIQLDSVLFLEGWQDGADASVDTDTKIQPGSTISVTKTYLLRDTTTPITVEMKKLFDFVDDYKVEFTITLD